MRAKNGIFPIIYGIMLGLFVIVIIYLALAAGSTGKSIADAEYDRTVPFMAGWHTADGTELDEKALRKINTVSADKEISVYNTIPESLKNADALFFRAKNVFYSVYIEGELIYEPELPESVFYTNSTGTRWNSIDLLPEYLGKEIEIRLTAAYKTARCGLDGFRIGAGGAILNVIKDKMASFIVCVLLLFVGLLLSIADIPINMRRTKNHELLYLGLFSICVATWCLTELNVIQFFFDNSRLLQVVSCGSLMLIPFPLVLYLNAAVGFKHKAVVPVICTMSAVEFVVCWGLHLLKIKDIHETITLSHIIVAIASVLLVYSFVKDAIVKSRENGVNIYHILRTIGLCSIGIAAVIDIARYYSGQTSDSAQFVRVGMLIFAVCYGSSSLENTVNAVKMGAQAEFVSRLAYHDGLTGIGNRTAFEERLAELEKAQSGSPVGIVMFDVNDLKYVNDNLGHPLGDVLIKTAAEIISASFSSENDECFRIGGDEFAVIMRGENIAQRYEKGMIVFNEQTEQRSSSPENVLRISIAHGFFVYDSECGLTRIEEAYKKADEKMYETKREMKALQSTPEEYYAARRAKANAM